MPAQDFFARMQPEFVEHEGSARENAARQAQVERLLAKAEYEFGKLRSDLGALVPLTPAPGAEIEPVRAEAEHGPVETARAA